MNNNLRGTLFAAIALTLASCSLGKTPNNPSLANIPALGLTVQLYNPADETFMEVGQVIAFSYIVTNTGNVSFTERVNVLDDKAIPLCPFYDTVGNQDASLDPQEFITCGGSYTITQADLNAGSVTNKATASVGAVNSNPAGITVPISQIKVFRLEDTVDPVNYDRLSQTITHTYVIRNELGNVTLGPTQFTISDDHMGTLNCGPAALVLQRHESLTCTATYSITQADMNTEAVKFTATAAGGGATAAMPAIIIFNNNNLQNNPPTPAADLAPGTTIQYTVAAGDWLIQIARCYGADYQEVRKANPQITNPAIISPALIVTIPHIGSAGPIYGPPCVGFHTVQAGDTWASIAQKYNADLHILQWVNPGALYVGRVLKVPLHSA